MPGILTGTIIGMAHALGETAPLLLIGMIAFVVDVPGGFARPGDGCCRSRSIMWATRSASLPSSSAPRRRSWCCSVFLIAMNAIAIILRKRLRTARGSRWTSWKHASVAGQDDQHQSDARNERRSRHGQGPRGRKVTVFYGDKQALFDVDLDRSPERAVTSLIGPSGCGKSTFLRCINRMNDTIEGCRVTGKIELDGQDIYDPQPRRGRAPRPRRHGVPEAQSVPQVDLRERRLRPAHPRPGPQQGRARRDRHLLAAQAPASWKRSRTASTSPAPASPAASSSASASRAPSPSRPKSS